MAEGSTSAQHDIGELVSAQKGSESEKITERKVNREGGRIIPRKSFSWDVMES